MNQASTSPVVTVERTHPHVALVTIQRPLARNAVNVDVTHRLGSIVAEIEADPDVWAAILTGAGGKAFCAGADLKDIAAGRGSELFTTNGGFAGFVQAERRKPWIAAVDGIAFGGGFELALACDLIVASTASVFAMPEASRGVIAAGGGLYRLPQVLPRNVALELIVAGTQLHATRAYEFGLVNRLAVDGEVLAAALLLAASICANAPLAVSESLMIARRGHELDDVELQAMTRAARDRITQTLDYHEGPRAFVEKRPPAWTGR